ncbi:MAG: AbrB/MazE/SpoVT family DNA-binding domain-containing protein [Candidatus Fimadaptatus sp.]
MRDSGIVRRVDNLGRIVIPMEMRRALSIEIHDPMEIFMDGDSIVLRRKRMSCSLCGAKDALHKLDDKFLCESCVKRIKSLW